jgi:hypothetical protein
MLLSPGFREPCRLDLSGAWQHNRDMILSNAWKIDESSKRVGNARSALFSGHIDKLSRILKVLLLQFP